MGRHTARGTLWGLTPEQIEGIDLIILAGGRVDTPELERLKRVLVRRGLIENIGSRIRPRWVRVNPHVDPRWLVMVMQCIEYGDDTGGLFVDRLEEWDRLDALYILKTQGLIYQTCGSWDRGWGPK